jgi:hypothetical protein
MYVCYLRKIVHNLNFVGYEVLTAVVIRNSVFSDITPCSSLTFIQLHGVISQKIEHFNVNLYFQ